MLSVGRRLLLVFSRTGLAEIESVFEERPIAVCCKIPDNPVSRPNGWQISWIDRKFSLSETRLLLGPIISDITFFGTQYLLRRNWNSRLLYEKSYSITEQHIRNQLPRWVQDSLSTRRFIFIFIESIFSYLLNTDRSKSQRWIRHLETMDHDAAVKYLESFLGRTLRAHTTDGVGTYISFFCARTESFW